MSGERTFDVPMDPGDGAIYTLRFPSEELARRTIRQIESGVRHENATQGCAAFKARVATLLRRMEFAVMTDNQWGDGVAHSCPCCGGRRFEDEPHRPGCELFALLKEGER